MNDLLHNIEEFDEESQRLLRGIATSGSIIRLDELERGSYGKGNDPF